MSRSTVSGAADIVAALNYLSGEIGTPSARAARKALTPTLKAARKNAPKDEGDLKKSLTVKRVARMPQNKNKHLIGPRADFVGDDGDAPVRYAHITEFGKADGSVRGTRWMSRAFEETKDEAVEIYAREIGPEIEKAAARKAKRRAQRRAAK